MQHFASDPFDMAKRATRGFSFDELYAFVVDLLTFNNAHSEVKELAKIFGEPRTSSSDATYDQVSKISTAIQWDINAALDIAVEVAQSESQELAATLETLYL